MNVDLTSPRRRWIALLLGLHLLGALSFAQPRLQAQAVPPAEWSFTQWLAACGKLPSNRELRGRLPVQEALPLQSYAQLSPTVDGFLTASANGPLKDAAAWVGGAPAAAHFLNPDAAWFLDPAVPFQPFSQKLVLPEGSEVFLHGDLHGDVHSINASLSWLNSQGYLREFQVARTNFHMVFLGDYTDRGAYGAEVMYVLLRLKLANPDRVWLVRGNHEEYSMIGQYGFMAEARAKFGAAFDARKVSRIFDYLPVVLYLGTGTNFAQCNHGGMEPGYDPRPLLASTGSLRFHLLGELRQATFVKQHSQWLAGDARGTQIAGALLQDFAPKSPTSPSVLGFMWNDFTLLPTEPQLNLDPGRAFVYGNKATEYLLNQAQTAAGGVRTVFRAHQHASVLNPMMRRLVASRGLYRHWQTQGAAGRLDATPAELRTSVDVSEERPVPPGSVWTFNVSPDSAYGVGCGYDFDTFGMLRLAPSLAEWKLRVVNVRVGQAPGSERR